MNKFKLFLIAALFCLLPALVAAPISAVAGEWSASGSLIYYTDGNVSIGTASPSSNFHVQTSSASGIHAYFRSANASFTGDVVKIYGYANSNSYNNLSIVDSAGSTKMVVKGDGKVGVGTGSPSAQSHIYSSASGGGVISYTQAASSGFSGEVMKIYGYANSSSYKALNIVDSANNVKLLVRGDGKVGIGTSNPQRELAVNGTVLAKEVIVSTAGAYWPDYVFDNAYSLMPLSELQSFIKENKHLPGIPTEATMSDVGVPLGEMQRLQMEKIEELTLYILQQEERIVELEKAVKLLSE